MRKRNKKILAVFLTGVLLVSTFSINVIAAENNNFLATDVVDISKGVSGQSEVASISESSYDLALQKIVTATEQYQDQVDISEYNIDRSDMPKMTEDLLYENPQLFYVDNILSYSYYPSSGKVAVVTLTFNFTQQEVAKEQLKIDEISSYIVAMTKNMNTETEKALYIHDYLVLNTEYDTQLFTTGEALEMSYCMYGALIDNVAVCQGYMLAYMYLLEEVGIESIDVTSESMDHTWNLVKIDGEWYHVDVTWDDPTPDIYGQVLHKHFLLNNNEISSNHSGFTSDYPSKSTKYSDAFWKNVSAQIINQSGDLFYTNSNKELVNSDINGNVSETLPFIADKWEVLGGGGSYYYGSYAKLATDYSKVYYNTSKAIYSVDFNGKNEALVYQPKLADNELIYGLVILNGTLYYSTSSAPNVDDKLKSTGIVVEDNSVRKVIKGDIDFNGINDITDALSLQMYLANMINFTDEQKIVADYDENGRVNIADVVYLQAVLAKLLNVSYIYI